MKTLMRNGRDRRSENPRCATRAKSACFWLGPISGSHQGPQPERLHSEAGYMAAPERFAQPPDSPLAPRAPMVWTPPSRPGRMSGRELQRGRIIMQVVRIGLDLAKYVFEVHGVDERGNVVLRKTL